MADSELKVVRANRFVLEDENGVTRAILALVDDETVLCFRDGKDKERIRLSVDSKRVSLTLRDENCKLPGAALEVNKFSSRLTLRDATGVIRAMLAVPNEDGPILNLRDENGKVRAELTVTSDGPRLAMLDEDGETLLKRF